MRILRYLTLAAGLSLAVPAVASASIVPQRGMLGGTLNMTANQLKERIGPPSAVRTRSNEIFGAYDEYRWGEVYVSAFRSNGMIFNYFTQGRSARTTSGVGVGSTETYLKSKVTGEVCRTNSGARTCVVGEESAGQIVTAFRINAATGRVKSITVGRVID
jgi:hypothetical protein